VDNYAGSGIESCVGDRADGDVLDTADEGSHTFSVTATDRAGNTSTTTTHYTVAPDPPQAFTDEPGYPEGGYYYVDLRGAVDTGGLPGTWHFEYGPTTGYGRSSPVESMDPTYWTPYGVFSTVLELPAGTYHYRLVVDTRLGEATGEDRTFKIEYATSPQPADHPSPTVQDASAQEIGSDAATLVGNISHYGLPTTYWFEYGPTADLGSATPEDSPLVTWLPIIAYARLTGLEPATTYHFRLMARNANGTATGEDETFTTASPDPPPPPAEGAMAPSPRVAVLASTADVDSRGRFALPLVVRGSRGSWSGSLTVYSANGTMLGERRDIALAAERRTRVKLTLSRSALRRLRHAGRRRMAARVTVKLHTRAGLRVTLRRAITLRAR
jgi:hypothetical protein